MSAAACSPGRWRPDAVAAGGSAMATNPEERKRPTLFDLINDVVEGGSCSQCGACVVACPYGILTYHEGFPQAWEGPSKHHGSEIAELIIGGRPQDFCPISENVGCDCCAAVCPKLNLEKERLEVAMFGRPATPEERVDLGAYRTIEFTRTRDPRVQKVGQDGGFVTSLLAWALREGIIDGAVVTRVDPGEPCRPVPFVATTEKEILQSAGSWYTYSANTLGLMEAYERGLKRVAFVGTPCQVTPLRKLQVLDERDMALVDPTERNFLRQYGHLQKFREIIAFTVGLLCSETFLYEGLMKEHIQGRLGIPLADVAKFNIKGKVLVHRKSGEVAEFPLKDAFPYARPHCSFCGDFSSEEADISAGGVGTNGWTLTIARTPLGAELYERFKATRIIEVKPADEFSKAVAIARKLAQKQRLRQQEAYAARARGEAPGQH